MRQKGPRYSDGLCMNPVVLHVHLYGYANFATSTLSLSLSGFVIMCAIFIWTPRRSRDAATSAAPSPAVFNRREETRDVQFVKFLHAANAPPAYVR